jgi:amidophosphoribosyltransferase
MEVGEKCGVVLSHNLSEALEIVREMKNRGKESSGVGVKIYDKIDAAKWKGDGNSFSEKRLYEILYGPRVESGIVIGHARYSRKGGEDLDLAHPHCIDPVDVTDNKTHIITRGARAAIVHNGNVPDIDDVLSGLGMERYRELKTDSQKILAIYANLGVNAVIENLLGSFSLVILDGEREEAFAMRDRFGFKPLWIGESSGKAIITSEDSLITAIGGFPIREVNPGECVYIYPDGRFLTGQPVESFPMLCHFEFQYFSRWESHMMGKSVRDVRYQEGLELAKEFMPEDIDIVTYLPETPRPAADAYGRAVKEKRGLRESPVQEIFYKMKPKDRSYMGGDRKRNIRENLYIKDDADVKGKVVIILEDSIVTANNIEWAAELLRSKGAKKVYVTPFTPPIMGEQNGGDLGCPFGVETPPKNELAINRYGSIEGIAKAAKIDELHYLSREGMIRGIGLPENRICTYCIGGPNPIEEYRKHLKLSGQK